MSREAETVAQRRAERKARLDARRRRDANHKAMQDRERTKHSRRMGLREEREQVINTSTSFLGLIGACFWFICVCVFLVYVCVCVCVF
jgi:hypothetical protein